MWHQLNQGLEELELRAVVANLSIAINWSIFETLHVAPEK